MDQQSIQKRRKKPFPHYIIVFLAPATIIYTIFMVFPLLDSLRLSLFTPGPQGQPMFIGLGNYVNLMTDEIWSERFWGALANNFVFFFVHMLVQNPIGLLLAAMLRVRRIL